MNNVARLIAAIFIIGSCACGSIPKAGPVSTQEVSPKKRIEIPSAKKAIKTQPRLELPAITDSEDIVTHIGFTASYNHETLIPNWVAYELTREEVNGSEKGDESFQWDPDIKGRQAWREDYARSGWDKGHMIPRADLKWSAKAYSESFYFSNVCPQDPAFNTGSWRTTESMGRRLAKQYGSVFIVCGPLVFDNKYGTLGEHKVVIPDAFFKAFLICVNGEYSAIGIIMDNIPEKQNLKQCAMSVDEVEDKCGLDLFHDLDISIQSAVESRINWKMWGI